MFNFLKKFFKSEEKEEIVELGLSDVKSFFNDKAKEITRELNQKIRELKEKTDYEIYKTRKNLENLSKAKLRNPNIPVKAKHFMEGNRAAYIKTVNSLIDFVAIRNDYDAIIKFCEDFNNRLIQFAKSTTKAYQVLQEFFAHESREIALNIKQIDRLVKELKNLLKEANIGKLKQLKVDIVGINEKKEHRAELEKELKEKEIKKQEEIKLSRNLERMRNELKESNEYAEFLSLVELKKKSLKELEDLKAKIFHSFSVINAALKKYLRITIKDADLLGKYIGEPVNALLSDNELKVIELLNGARKNILDNKIELKDKKKDKILAEINRLNKEFFDGFKNKYKEIEEKIKDLEERIKENNPKRKLEEFDKKSDEKQADLGKLETYIIYLNKEIEKIDFEKIKKELEEKIKCVFKVEVRVS